MLILLKALLAAVLGGAVTSMTEVLSAPGNTNPYDMGRLRNAAIAGALIGLVGYLKQSPVKTEDQRQGEAALARERVRAQVIGEYVNYGTGINPGK